MSTHTSGPLPSNERRRPLWHRIWIAVVASIRLAFALEDLRPDSATAGPRAAAGQVGFGASATTEDVAREALREVPEADAIPAPTPENTAPTTSDAMGDSPAISGGRNSESTGRAPIAKAESSASMAEAASGIAASERFLQRMEEGSRRHEAAIERDAEALGRFEQRVFWALLAVGVLTALLAVAGVILAVAGHVAVGVLSAALAVLPGAGTLILTRLSKTLGDRRNEIVRMRSENERVLDAIQATLMIPVERDRNLQVQELASAFRQRATAADTPNRQKSSQPDPS